MRAAIIGYGVIGKVHAKAIGNQGTLVAVCDVDEEKLREAPDVPHYRDYQEMLREVKPDVVHICTPHYLHADMVVEVLSRGINVLCEKPLCIKAEDIDRILEAERKSSAKLGVCQQNRYNRANRFVKEYLDGKQIECGTGQVSWHRDATYYASGEWRGKWETEGGGVLINQALHTLDLLQWFCGMPEYVTASISTLKLKGAIEVEDTATLLCDGNAGFAFHATNGCQKSAPVEVTLRADGEWIKIMPKYVVTGETLHTFTDDHEAHGKACYGSGHEALIADFYDCIEQGRDFPIGGKEGVKVIRLILAAYESCGERIKISASE